MNGLRAYGSAVRLLTYKRRICAALHAGGAA